MHRYDIGPIRVGRQLTPSTVSAGEKPTPCRETAVWPSSGPCDGEIDVSSGERYLPYRGYPL